MRFVKHSQHFINRAYHNYSHYSVSRPNIIYIHMYIQMFAIAIATFIYYVTKGFTLLIFSMQSLLHHTHYIHPFALFLPTCNRYCNVNQNYSIHNQITMQSLLQHFSIFCKGLNPHFLLNAITIALNSLYYHS